MRHSDWLMQDLWMLLLSLRPLDGYRATYHWNCLAHLVHLSLCCLQVIEKALKKLKLDAMIIQQGRLSDNKSSVNKDDLLSMVRYGAEMVFSGGGGTITDEDIDAIIAKVCTLPTCPCPASTSA